MRIFPSINVTQMGRETTIILLAGISVGIAVAMASAVEPKWMFFILFSIIALAVVMIIPEREKFLIYMTIFVFLLPFGFDIHFFHIKTSITIRPIYGLRINAVDIPFFFLMISWIYRLTIDPQVKIKFYPEISIPMIIIMFLVIAGLNRGHQPRAITVSAFWLVFRNWLIFLYLSNNIIDRGMVYKVIVIFIATGVVQSLIGMVQYVTEGTLGAAMLGESEKSFFVMRAGAGTVSRVAGTIGHPNKLALYLAMVLQINWALLFSSISRRTKFLLSISLVIMAATMLLTYSRGGWLGLGLGGIVITYWCLARTIRHRVLSAIIMLVLVVTIAFTSVFSIESVQRRLFEDDYGAAKTRLPMTMVALNMIRSNPWLGVGLTNYVSMAVRYDTSSEGIAYNFPAPVHNEFLLIAAELGLPVLFLFIVILLLTFRLIYYMGKSRADPALPFIAIGLFGAWLGWCLHNQFEYDYLFLSQVDWFILGIIYAMGSVVRKAENGERLKGARLKRELPQSSGS